jgi:hypothetical protein
VILGPLVRELDHAPANDHLSIGVFPIPYREGNPRVATDVGRLHAALGGVDEDVVAVRIDPHRRGLR